MSVNSECMHQQCRLSVETAQKLTDFIAEVKRDREECAFRYKDDRMAADQFREKVLTLLSNLDKKIEDIAPPVRFGKRIAWGVIATTAVGGLTAIGTGLIYGLWKFIKFILRSI